MVWEDVSAQPQKYVGPARKCPVCQMVYTIIRIAQLFTVYVILLEYFYSYNRLAAIVSTMILLIAFILKQVIIWLN